MLGVTVLTGAIFSIQTKRRRETTFDNHLRAETLAAIDGVREMQRSTGPLPPAPNDARCPKCSLVDACMPASVVGGRAGVASGSLDDRLKKTLFSAKAWEAL